MTTIANKRVVGYYRVSTLGQAGEQHVSLETQETRVRDYCQRSGAALVDGFTDVASGRKDDRKEYRRMLDYVVGGNADTIVVQFLDRFGRNPREILRRIWSLQEAGADVVATDEDIKEELLLLVRAGLAGAESKRTAERVKVTMRSAAGKGSKFGRDPFGYRRVRDGAEVRWEQRPEEAAAVRRMFTLAVEENLGYKAIADRMNAEGYPTRNGRPWASFTVMQMLRNEALAGVMVYGRQPKKGNAQQEILRVPGFYPAILSPQEWQQLEERRAIRRFARYGKTHTSHYLLSGVLRCGYCGGIMVGNTTRTYHNYVCNNRRRSTALCAEYNYQGAKRLEAAVLRALGEYMDPQRVRELLDAGDRRERDSGIKRLAAIDRNLGKLDAELKADLDLLRRGLLDERDFAVANGGRRERRQALEDERQKLSEAVRAEQAIDQTSSALPKRIGSFMEIVENADVVKAKAALQTILAAVHAWKGRIELEFRE